MLRDVFAPEAVSADVAAFNAAVAQRDENAPNLWDIGIERARDAGFMPELPVSPRAYDLSIGDGVALHVVPASSPRGVLLHIHGGGFILGSAARQDSVLERITKNVGVTCVSVEYRLAPEHPYPAAWEDCERAALWLLDHAATEFNAQPLLIAGESAGALLAVATLLRLRDRGAPPRFKGAALNFGVYDSSMTPSQTLALEGALSSGNIAKIVDTYMPDVTQRRSPDASPIFADLRGMPPALFTVGTLDAMLDDSMFMYCRWLAAGASAELAIYRGADHGFIETPHPHAAAANAGIDRFLADCLTTP